MTAFIPLLTGTGGNVGTQSSTVVICGMNTDEIRSLGALQVIGREAIATVLLGISATVWAYLLQGRLALFYDSHEIKIRNLCCH